ncbi:MAG: fumarylacetoacetate hydrolase family protein [Alphaproteobacteria bacterium]|nr:fumarylacetoacetate hydrolase family protein [Alphaproteobacteria bacterium]
MVQLVSFTQGGRRRPGALKAGRVLDLAAAGLPAGAAGDLLALVEGGAAVLDTARAAIDRWAAPDHAAAEVRLEAPIARPPKVIGIGLNYVDHCREAGLPEPQEPVLFGKYSNSVVGPYDDIVWHEGVTTEVDFEVELGFVIGQRASRVPEARALDHVFGYTIVNDVTARDIQFAPPGQWDRGKSLDTFCPTGPALVTADEIGDPQTLGLRLTLNGAEMQRSNTSNMIFGIAHLVAYLSRTMTLEPGDLVATGTPFGVGFARKPPVFLKDGDDCIAEIDRIGRIRNRARVVRAGG